MGNKLKYGAGVCLSLFILLGSGGCGAEQAAWEEAKKENSDLAYGYFLKKYPASDHAPEANYRMAESINSIIEVERLLRSRRFPEGVWKQKARALLGKLYLKKVEKINNIDAFRAVLKFFPDGESKKQAEKKLMELYFQDADSMDTIQAYTGFIERYPASPLAEKAKERLKKLKNAWHPRLAGARTVKFRIRQHYQQSPGLKLDLKKSLEGILAGLGLKKAGPGENNPDLLIDISLSGQALSKRYSLYGLPYGGSTRYAGASIRGSISLKAGGITVTVKTFAGRQEAPRTIYGNKSYREPKQAPYRSTIYLKNSLIQKYFEALGTGFGPEALNLPLVSRDKSIAACAADALIRLRGDKSLDTFKRLAANEKYQIRLTGIEGMSRLKTNDAAETLLALMSDKDRAFRRSVVWQLGNFRGDRIIDRMILLLKNDPDPIIRKKAADIIGKSRVKKGLEPLLTALDDENKDVRSTVIEHLGHFQTEKLLNRLITALREDDDYRVRRQAAEILGKSGSKKVIAALVAALQDQVYQVRFGAAKSLQKRGWRPHDNRERVFYYIAQARWLDLERMGKRATEGLLKALPWVSADICRTLGKIKDPLAVDSLVRTVLEHKAQSVREEAAWALGEIGEKKAVEPLIIALGKKGNLMYREKTIKALGKLRDRRAVLPLIRSLRLAINSKLRGWINDALKKITGQQFKASWQVWDAWWKKSGK